MNKLLIKSRQLSTYQRLVLDAKLPDLTLTDDPTQATLILADPPLIAGELQCYPQLQWLQSTFAGIDALIERDDRRDYQLTNVRGIFGPLIAEYVLGLLIPYYRQFARYHTQQEARQWQPHSYPSLVGKNLLILGTGSIGAYLAKVANTMGMQVSGVNRSGITPSDDFTTLYDFTQLGDALASADVIVSTLPATSETRDILNGAALNRCRCALFFSVGRGDVIDETALLDAVNANAIAHAWLDVFKQEPLAETHPFWAHPRITITPHVAAESFPEQVFTVFTHNYRRWHAGAPLDYVVDFAKGY
uniref:D-2-hydroxyacid dehydrogenase n=1 Tax=Thaumasiovibrio occultus TaxID=1891184 RepID=UPI000B361616|nr:D-2-hydroxyacid dehydrogenase [Thaumasiovibrio occultus]